MITPVLAEELKDKPVINKAIVAFDKNCEGSLHHSPRPLLLRAISLSPWNGMTKPSVWLCGNCSDNLAVFQELLEKYDGKIPYRLQLQFGIAIRDLGKRGWQAYEEKRF